MSHCSATVLESCEILVALKRQYFEIAECQKAVLVLSESLGRCVPAESPPDWRAFESATRSGPDKRNTKKAPTTIKVKIVHVTSRLLFINIPREYQ